MRFLFESADKVVRQVTVDDGPVLYLKPSQRLAEEDGRFYIVEGDGWLKNLFRTTPLDVSSSL